MIRKLTPEDYTVSAWSGGTTTQLTIEPPGALYADRSFLWRVSSATVELEASDFTPLPDYDRLIATLKGDIVLSHNAGIPVVLHPLEVHAFSGADETRSLGRCTDFNLMLRRSRAAGKMEALRLTADPILYDPDPADQALLCCAEGSCLVQAEGEELPLTAGESLLMTAPVRAELCTDAEGSVVMACAMRRVSGRKAENPRGKNIYFAGSIRGGRADAALYRRMIECMKQNHTVLTEHVGDLSLSALERGPKGDSAIYDQDTAWLRRSDLVIAECTCPSLGVGYELAYAERFSIPVHIFYNKEKAQLSAMLTGDPYFRIHPYTREEEIFPALDQILQEA